MVTRPNRSGPPPFSVGDKVQVTVTVEQLKTLQQGHGGWNPRMAEVIYYFILVVIKAFCSHFIYFFFSVHW